MTENKFKELRMEAFEHPDIEIFSRKGYPYQVTNKLDGERCFLFFNNNQVFSIGKGVNFVCTLNQKYELKTTKNCNKTLYLLILFMFS